MIPAAVGGNLVWILAGIVVFIAFYVASRLIARFAAEQLRARNVRADMIVVGRRVVYVLVIIFGVFAAFGFALQSANVTLAGILLATVVAALGVQDLLKDYVSGYYVLLERHIRIGDHISLETSSGTVTDVRLRVTLLKSDAGDVIVVPNSVLFNRPVIVHNRVPAEAKPAPRE